MLKIATTELVDILREMGVQFFHLPGNEDEVSGILEAILNAKDSGYEIQGETAEAVANGEISLTELRILRNNFVDKLAETNIFPAERGQFDLLSDVKFQIDEAGLARKLRSAAEERGRLYSIRNSEHDASFIATVMRLRKKMSGRDLMDAGYVFVTTNRLLAHISRQFLVDEKTIRPSHVPPALNVGQASTIGWLLKKRTISPAIA
jgi:hypothetical protein